MGNLLPVAEKAGSGGDETLGKGRTRSRRRRLDMENEKDIKGVEKETREFLDGVTLTELRRLLDTTVFTGQVLEAASESERVSRAVDAVLDAEFQEMTPAQQER